MQVSATTKGPNRGVNAVLTLLLVLGATNFSHCKKQSQEPDNSASISTAKDQSGNEVQRSAVLARIDGIDISVGEFEDRINKQSPYIRARYTSLEQKKDFLDNLIRFEVLARQAKKEGFANNPDVVRTMKQVMIQKLMKDRFEKSTKPEDIGEDRMLAFYNNNPIEFHKPEEVRVSAIIIDKASKAESTAQEALGEKGQSNKGFRELVARFSTDKSTQSRGGDLRYFKPDDTSIPKAVVKAAFALDKTGDVAGPIATDKGFYIIKKTGHRKAIDKSFEQVKRQIQNRLYREERTQSQKDYIAELKKTAKIEIFEEALSQVKIDTSGAQEAHGGGHAQETETAVKPNPDLPAEKTAHGHSEATH